MASFVSPERRTNYDILAAKAIEAGYPAVHTPKKQLKATKVLFEDPPLGSGGEGTVYKAVIEGEICAQKRPHRKLTEEELFASIGFDHPNLMHCDQITSENYITMPLAHGNLAYAFNNYLINRHQLLATLQGVIAGLQYLHQHGFIHGDIKALNIIQVNERFIINDYGCCRQIEGLIDAQQAIGTISHTAPEVFKNMNPDFIATPLTTAIDIYSFGAMLYSLLSGGKNIFSDETPEATIMYHFGIGNDLPVGWEESLNNDLISYFDPTGILCDMMFACLNINPEQRPTAANIFDTLSKINS